MALVVWAAVLGRLWRSRGRGPWQDGWRELRLETVGRSLRWATPGSPYSLALAELWVEIHREPSPTRWARCDR